jgi:hypothetical protein
MAARRKLTPEQRVAEYVDSPMMTQRIRHAKTELSARIQGNYGVYRTRASLSGKVTGKCTCPSEWWPCKHVQALRKTWKANPKSFLDLDKFVSGLAKWPKAGLIDAIRQIALAWPESLSVFGVPGFEAEEDDEEYGEDDWDDEQWLDDDGDER